LLDQIRSKRWSLQEEAISVWRWLKLSFFWGKR
jgi:hypothetical protein